MEFCVKLLSLPLWERGLKFPASGSSNRSVGVAPLVGAWIEIMKNIMMGPENLVAPLVGAWIEIVLWKPGNELRQVAPLVGAWIEIPRCCKAEV